MDVTTDTDTYDVINEGSEETFAMKENKCYSNVHDITSSESRDKTTATKKQPHFIALGVLLAVMMVLLAVSCVCAVAALAEISRLRAEMRSETSNLQSETSSLQSEVDRIDTVTQQLLTNVLQNDSHNLSELKQQSQKLIAFITLGTLENNPAISCTGLPHSFTSGYYWVRASNGSAVRVYCDTNRTCGGVTGGWMRVGYLDTTNSSHQCPSDLRDRNDGDIRTCVRSSDSPGCTPITLPIHMTQYSQVCGRVIAYQYGGTNAFEGGSINSTYVDGVSLTHGTPREHIWTFAATLDKAGDFSANSNCPCTQNMPSSSFFKIPSFVGDDYFCDAGDPQHNGAFVFYGADPLWDGAGCEPPNTCCSFNTPPSFYKQLPQPTTDDIEMRVCRNEDSRNEDIAIQVVEIYAQ